ncbi:MAG: hypothetical protein K0U23_08270 [Gammaproteobacteria bacterium]|nr:hypothetical protein [Gammaproteobacteria bacterium]
MKFFDKLEPRCNEDDVKGYNFGNYCLAEMCTGIPTVLCVLLTIASYDTSTTLEQQSTHTKASLSFAIIFSTALLLIIAREKWLQAKIQRQRASRIAEPPIHRDEPTSDPATNPRAPLLQTGPRHSRVI